MATPAQLAALKKARAARKKKTVKKANKKNGTRAAPKAKQTASYVVKVVTTTGKIGYYAGVSRGTLSFDDSISKACSGSKHVIDNFTAMIFMIKPSGIRSVETVKK